MAKIPEQYVGVSAATKANIYFEGKVVSHTLIFPDGSKKTLGLIFPGKYHFGTSQPEEMRIVAGSCEVKVDGVGMNTFFGPGDGFQVPGKSGFDIEVKAGICEYICSFEGC